MPAFPPGAPQNEQWRQSPRRGIRSAAIPELKQVIVAFAGQVIMRDTFEEALSDLFDIDAGASDLAPTLATKPVPSPPGIDLRSAAQMAAEADSHYQQVRTSLQQWNWAEAGQGMEALEKTIGTLRKTLEQAQ